MPDRRPDAASEARLDALREEARRNGSVAGREGIRPPGAPIPDLASGAGYYGLPLLKPPVWTWEVPAYFFVGGAAGASALVAFAGAVTGADAALVRDARRIAAAGAVLSAPLLISDLGRPERFLNMLRVFKPQSAMSVGAWLLTVFGGAAVAAAAADGFGWRRSANLAGVASALAGGGMATYTGVLLGATAIPAWAAESERLPVHFGASALGSAVALIELCGHGSGATNSLGTGAAAVETFSAARIEIERRPATEPLRKGGSGTMVRTAAVLSGPVPLLLRTLGSRSARAQRLAALSSLAGSLLTRFGWVAAGRKSAADPRIPLGR